jgi:hypothetical protein
MFAALPCYEPGQQAACRVPEFVEGTALALVDLVPQELAVNILSNPW